MIKAEILVPLLNANEPEARLVGIHVREGQKVEKGMLLFTLETTKAAADVEASESGFVRILASEGDTLSVGEKVALITETAEEAVEAPLQLPPHAEHLPRGGASRGGEGGAGLRITKPARALAEQLGVELSALPSDRLVTEAVVREVAGASATHLDADSSGTTQAVGPGGRVTAEMILYGGGGHAKTVLEMAQAIAAFRMAGIVDDNIPAGTSVLGLPVLGGREVLPGLLERGIQLAANGVGGIIDINVRVRLFELLEDLGFALPSLVHPRATVERSAQAGDGVQVFANAYVGSSAVLRAKCMVNTGAIVSHDCEIGSYSHIAPGALLAGHVKVGERSLVGMGVTTAIGITIGTGVRIGNGAILYADVPDKAIIPAGKVWAGQGYTIRN
jgi:sugar O-acyltransferase (sialic acid O-acetyltransferase NeuD family)